MAKQKTEPAIRYERGRWITSDGLSFNTQAKAEAHVENLKKQTTKTE